MPTRRADHRDVGVPDEVLEDVGRALRLGGELAEAGVELSLHEHPVTGRPTATATQGDGTVMVVALTVLADVDALRRTLLGAVEDRPG